MSHPCLHLNSFMTEVLIIQKQDRDLRHEKFKYEKSEKGIYPYFIDINFTP